MGRGKADLLPFALIPHKVFAVLTWEIECREGVRENWNSKDITIRKEKHIAGVRQLELLQNCRQVV